MFGSYLVLPKTFFFGRFLNEPYGRVRFAYNERYKPEEPAEIPTQRTGYKLYCINEECKNFENKLQFKDISYNNCGKEQCVRCLEECHLKCRYCTELYAETVWVPISKLTSHASECILYDGSDTYEKYGEQPPIIKGIKLASGSQDHTIRIRDMNYNQCIKNLQGHTDCVNSIIQLSDGRLASGSNDKTIRIWDIKNAESIKVLEGHTGYVNSIIQLTDGRIASASDDSGSYDSESDDKTIRIWDIKNAESIKVLEGHTGYVNSIIQLSDGRLASGSNDKTIRIWEINSGKCVKILEGYTGYVNSIIQLTDGRIASGSQNATICIWDINIGECVKLLESHTNNISWISMKYKNISKNLKLNYRYESHAINSIIQLSDGRLASGSNDKIIRIWEINSGKCVKILEGHTGIVRSIIEVNVQ